MAQNLLDEAAERERTRLGKGEHRAFLLTGLLTCGETRLPLVGQSCHSSNGTIHRYYHYPRKPKDLKNVRPRLSANELEEKVTEELKTALKTKGYFDNLEKVLRNQATENSKGDAAEFERVQKELASINHRISNIWENQSRMRLSDEALSLMSTELNGLAKEKQDLEKYLGNLDPNAADPQIYREKTQFIENQIRWCMQGWAKANPATRKRLLRRTIKELVVTRTEFHITFWTSADEREESLPAPHQGGDESPNNLVAFRPRPNRHNSSVSSSGEVKIGSGRGT